VANDGQCRQDGVEGEGDREEDGENRKTTGKMWLSSKRTDRTSVAVVAPKKSKRGQARAVRGRSVMQARMAERREGRSRSPHAVEDEDEVACIAVGPPGREAKCAQRGERPEVSRQPF
jgi:hypothetical protein